MSNLPPRTLSDRPKLVRGHLESVRATRTRVRVQALLGAVLGTVFTLILFLTIGRLAHERAAPVETQVDDLRAVALPMDPPPPPAANHEEELPASLSAPTFEGAATESPVKIAVVPPDLARLMPPPHAAPPAAIQVGQLYREFRPKINVGPLNQRIYQATEVDQLPRVLDRVLPQVSSRVRDGAQTLHVSLLFVVDQDGQVKNVRLLKGSGNAEFDDIMLDNIKQWTFSAAIRKGVRVRCLIQQGVTVTWNNENPFGS